jgi:hypothetical protein
MHKLLRGIAVTLAAGATCAVMAQPAMASPASGCSRIVADAIHLLERGGLPPALYDVYTVRAQLVVASRAWAGTPEGAAALAGIHDIDYGCF